MRKLIKTFICVFSLAVASFGLVACNEVPPAEPVTLTLDMVSLEYSSVAYDGTAKEPTVTITVNEETVSTEEYAIAYTNNTAAGTASVVVTAVEGSEVVSGTVTANFTIAKGTAVATNYEELVAALANTNYNTVRVTYGIIIPLGETLTIPADTTVVLDEVTIQNKGTINNQGTIMALAKNRAQLIADFAVADYIKLTANIEAVGSRDDIDVNAETRDYKFTLDMNGYNIESGLKFRTWGKPAGEDTNRYFNHSIDVSIINTSTQVKSTIGRIGDTPACYYGIVANGKDDLKITLDNVIVQGYYSGIQTNGSCDLGGYFTATNCKFSGIGLGAYMASNYEYAFTNCVFSGETGYYAKSGSHELTNCVFNGSAEYYAPQYRASSAVPTGSAIVIDSCLGGYAQELTVVITGGEFNSMYGYGIEEISTAPAGETPINYATVTYTGAEFENCPLGDVYTNPVAKNND